MIKHIDNMSSIKNIEGEIWQPIPEWEDFYEVSNKGRVKMLKRVIHRKDGKIQTFQERLKTLSPAQCNQYLMVTLTDKQRNRHETKTVHRLVGIEFIPNPLNLPEINHLKTKNDITVDDLEWSSRSDNQKDAYKRGLVVAKKGRDSHFARKIGMFDGDKLIKEFSHSKEAEKEGFTGAGIYQSIQLGCKHGGYNWKYLSNRNWTRRRPLKSVTPIGRFLGEKLDKVYTDRASLINEGYWVDNIYKCLKGKLKTYKGYQWKYLEEKVA